MAQKSGTQIAAKIKRKWDASAWLQGIQDQEGSPTQKAAQNPDLWANNTMAAKSLWTERCMATSKEDVVAAAKAKQGSYAGASDRAALGFQQVWDGGLGNAVYAAASALPARGSLAQNKQRSSQMIDSMAALRGKYRKRGRGM